MKSLLKEIRACTVCAAHLPYAPRPIVAAGPAARIVIIGQAPGAKVQASGIPWQDASGRLLREWLQVDETTFYDTRIFALVPMGFCYPGTGSSGDLPPRPECAPAWRAPLLATLTRLRLTVVLGRYAQAYHLSAGSESVEDAVRNWRRAWPRVIALPHPSPRNNGWLQRNAWFEREVLPTLRRRVRRLLAQ